MAPFLPIRATSRSQAVRIGKQTVKTGTTTYVDVGSQTETGGIKAGSSLPFSPFKELQNHLAIGAVVVVGALTASNTDYAYTSGGVVTASAEAEYTLAVSAGTLQKRSAGESTVATEAYSKAKQEKIAAAGKERIDLVSVNPTTGVYTETKGTAALTGLAVAPATPAEGLAVATVTTANNETAKTKVTTIVGKA